MMEDMRLRSQENAHRPVFYKNTASVKSPGDATVAPQPTRALMKAINEQSDFSQGGVVFGGGN